MPKGKETGIDPQQTRDCLGQIDEIRDFQVHVSHSPCAKTEMNHLHHLSSVFSKNHLLLTVNLPGSAKRFEIKSKFSQYRFFSDIPSEKSSPKSV